MSSISNSDGPQRALKGGESSYSDIPHHEDQRNPIGPHLLIVAYPATTEPISSLPVVQ